MTQGYKTTGFWAVCVATVAAAILGSGVISSDSMSGGISAVIAALGAAGYSSLRAFVKGDNGKPNWKTTEFWLSVAAVVVGAVLASGVFLDGSEVARLLGGASALLAALGYTTRFQLPPKVSK